MPRLRRVQSSFSAGVLDPRLAARIDIKAYYNGAETLDNAICIPHGGVARRPGLKYIDTINGLIVRETGQTITAPNGGTGANANDDDTSTELITTTNISTVNPYVVVRYDLGSAKTIKFADVVAMSLTTATNTEFFIQYSLDDSVWTSVGSALNLTTADYTVRESPDVSARYWRVARIGSTDLTTDKATLAEFNLFVESSSISDMRLIPFSFNTEQTYMIVATDKNLAIYKDDVLLVDVRVQYTSAQLNEIYWTQTADTLIITHKNIPPQRILRDTTAEGLWVVDDVPLTNTPQFDFGGGAEDVWSATRGWPRTVTFFQGRMVFGGSLGRPQGIWLSVANSFYDFDVGTGQADEAIVGALDTDQVNEIRNVVPGRKLEVFTSGGEFIVPHSPATPENFSVIRQTSYGSANVRTASIDGATVYAQRSGQSIREFLHSFQEDASVSNSISQLSTHLIQTPIDIDAVIGSSNSENNYIFIVNTGGNVVVLNTLREQEINAWSGPWTTEGTFKRVGVLDLETYFVAQRVINSVTVNYLEKLVETVYTDSALVIASHSSATVTGLDHLEGEVVRVKLGGAVQSDATVSSGSITLDRTPVAETLEVGLEFNPEIKTMPVSDGFKDGPTLNREKRIVRCTINRYESLGIFVNGERLPDRQLDSDTFDDVPSPSSEVTEIYLNGWSQTAQVTITQEDPVPMTILALDLEVSA
ncbi:MAG: hypothetical protein KAR06_03800 [Deltaproteobacteria bacterium]|nr:hypothetical protein [Deltaproteobacteria bacterium]